jgi:ribosomal protein S7
MSESDNRNNFKLVKKINDRQNAEIIKQKSHLKSVKRASYSQIEAIHTVDHILEDAKKIFGVQVQRMKIKAAQGYALDLQEMKQLETCVSNILKIKKDDREEAAQEKLAETLANMSNEELLQHATEVLSAEAGLSKDLTEDLKAEVAKAAAEQQKAMDDSDGVNNV